MHDSFLNDLAQTLAYLRGECSRAVVDRKHELHHLGVITRGLNFPEARTVVLRSIDWEQNSLFFQTDVRSAKFRELKFDSKISLLGYSRRRKYQIRFRGTAFLHHRDAVAVASWRKLGVSSRRTYLAQNPGAPMAQAGSGIPAEFQSPDLALEATEPGFKNFVSVRVAIEEMDWLLLSPEGHRRALFQFPENSPVAMNWLCP
jgi:pyridoxamine 5'-phosphate oxidase